MISPSDPPTIIPGATSATIPDLQIGKPTFAINLQAFPDENCRAMLTAIQEKVAAVLPPGAYRCPSRALHFTAFPILWARANHGCNVQAHWAALQSVIIKRLDEAIAPMNAFRLEATSIEARAAAIIVRYRPPQELECLRQQIANMRALNRMITRIPDLTHTTLFRFTCAMPLAPIVDSVADIGLPDLRWTVRRLILAQENVYPALQITALATFDLPVRSCRS